MVLIKKKYFKFGISLPDGRQGKKIFEKGKG
jgi:hypothetical protein